MTWWPTAYLAAGLAVVSLQPHSGPVVWYPALAIGVAWVWFCGLRSLPGVFAVEVVVAMAQFGTMPAALVAGLVTAAESGAVVALLRRWRFDPQFGRIDDVLALVTTSAAVCLAGAAVAVPLQEVLGGDDTHLVTTASVWFVGDLAGILSVAPVLFLAVPRLFVGASATEAPVPRGQRAELALVTVGGLVTTAWAFARIGSTGGSTTDLTDLAGLMLCTLPVLWMGIRFGRLRTALFALAVNLVAVASFDRFSSGTLVDSNAGLVGAQSLVGVVSLAGLLVAVAVDAQRTGRREIEAVLDASPVAVVSLDRERRATAWNRASERIFGWSADEVIGRIPPMVPADQLEAFVQRGPAQLGGPTQVTTRYRHRDGHLVQGTLSTNPLRDAEGRVVGVVGVIEDVTEHLQLQSELDAERSERQALIEALSRVERGATAEDTAGALCRVATLVEDIEGAALLQEGPDGELVALGIRSLPTPPAAPSSPLAGAAPRLRALAAHGPWWARPEPAAVATDPFARVLSQSGITAIGGAPVVWEGRVAAQLVCVTSRPDGLATPERRLSLFAEIATYAGALLGPQLADAERRSAARERIAGIIAERSAQPVFQPVVDLHSGAVVGHEALTRFADGTAPDATFAEAARVGLGHELERSCLAAAVEAARGLPAGTWLSLNVSPSLVLHDGIAALLASADRQVVLEITEHAPVDDYRELNRALAALPGVQVSVDDAGAGYASLTHILELRPDIVKLDMGLVRGLDADPARQALVAGMRYFAERTGTVLLAEGVEHDGEAKALRDLGIGLAQGYLYGRPAAAPGPTRPSA
jgi:PAS domain S-box-containing protein